MNRRLDHILGNFFGGTASMLVTVPSAIAFGIIIYSPLGSGFATAGAIAGIIGTIIIGLLAPVFGGTPKLISGPCAPAAAVLSVFVVDIIGNNGGSIRAEMVPSLLLIVIVLCGLLQIVIGLIGGGHFIKYIPYSVVSGYLSSVGLLIIIGQLPKLFSIPDQRLLVDGLFNPSGWKLNGLIVGCTAMFAMLFAQKRIRRIPATIISLLLGIAVYWALSGFYPEMRILKNNSMVIGPITGGMESMVYALVKSWQNIPTIDFIHVGHIGITAGTLAVLLSIDTLKTCVVLDTLTRSRHDSDRELIGQGIANLGSGLAGGVAGAGTMGATLVNVQSGATGKASGILVGILSLAVLLFLDNLIAWVPLPALAGILIVIGMRMIDIKSFNLLKHSSTQFDFVVYIAVVITALLFNLIAAAGMGIILSILIFLRDQVRQPVIRRIVFGNQVYSKKRRLKRETKILEHKGKDILVVELQGPLFFGTADQLLAEIEPYLAACTYVILDMRRVHAVDYTAVHRLDQIEQTIRERKGVLIFTSVPLNLPTGQNVQDYMSKLGLSQSGRHIMFCANLDQGIQWAEDKILFSVQDEDADLDIPLHLSEFSLLAGIDQIMLAKLMPGIVERTFEPGQTIFLIGDDGSEIFFIRKGSVRIDLPLSGGMVEHLATFGKGDFFGDMAFLITGNRSASAVAEDRVWLYYLSRSSFDSLTADDLKLREIIFERLAAALADRLRQTDIIIKTLVEC